MKNLCRRFDKYRDGELAPEERDEFEAHLASCSGCRTKSLLLHSVVQALGQDEPPAPAWLAEQVAAKVFERTPKSWDLQLLYWLRPTLAWSAVALLLLVVSSFWLLPSVSQPAVVSEYEALMAEMDPAKAAANAVPALTDDQLEAWLEQGGEIQ